MQARHVCPKVNLKIRGVDFQANLIVLESKGIDVILGMDWLSKNKGIIDCAKKSVKLTPTKGKEIEYTAEALITPKGAVNKVILNKLDVESTEGVKVVEEFTDVFSRGVARYAT